jgi:hypothetical protein
MQQRQPRLGDILDDYCPRERRLTNHAVVAMVGQDVKQTRCTTCEAEHEYKHAKVPRQRRKAETPAVLYSQVLAGGPKRVAHDTAAHDADAGAPRDEPQPREASDGDGTAAAASPEPPAITADPPGEAPPEPQEAEMEEGPVHRPLIRATLPRQEGQPPPVRPAPDFTIRQPAGRPFRFRSRHQRGGQPPFPGRSTGSSMAGGPGRGGAPRQGDRPPMPSRLAKRHGPGRKRSK